LRGRVHGIARLLHSLTESMCISDGGRLRSCAAQVPPPPFGEATEPAPTCVRVLHVCLVEQHDTCATDVYARGTLSLIGRGGGGEERARVEKVRKGSKADNQPPSEA
jgi:hypothetical protein